ncbi:MAG: hypothetical protein SO112_06740 [Treponema sp.]|nr:hypothetical protein [Treponema sp.]MDY4985703.1 hypothetical protein [Treponema sp.]
MEIEEFESVLDKEAKVLTELADKQVAVKQSVIDRDWENLVVLISDVNRLSDSFKEIDLKRDQLQNSLDENTLKNYYSQLGSLRSQLLKCKVENRVITDYVNIAKTFIQEVVEKALPQSRNKNYSRNGKIVQPQPLSVVVNQLF